MSYRLEPGEGVADGVRRIVAEELDSATDGLRKGAAGTPEDRDTAIHEARKSLKKTRSALRLVRADLKPKTRTKESAAMRDAGRRLSGARDAQVMLDTLAKVAKAAVPPRTGATRSPRSSRATRGCSATWPASSRRFASASRTGGCAIRGSTASSRASTCCTCAVAVRCATR
jgi:hypothetical protein